MPFGSTTREKASPRRQQNGTVGGGGGAVFPLSLFGRRPTRETVKDQLETLEQQSELLKGIHTRDKNSQRLLGLTRIAPYSKMTNVIVIEGDL